MNIIYVLKEQALSELVKDETIVITPADEGNKWWSKHEIKIVLLISYKP